MLTVSDSCCTHCRRNVRRGLDLEVWTQLKCLSHCLRLVWHTLCHCYYELHSEHVIGENHSTECNLTGNEAWDEPFTSTLCSEKKHPLKFSFISPWIICGFKQKTITFFVMCMGRRQCPVLAVGLSFSRCFSPNCPCVQQAFLIVLLSPRLKASQLRTFVLCLTKLTTKPQCRQTSSFVG